MNARHRNEGKTEQIEAERSPTVIAAAHWKFR
jgi:hypothetical protein